MKRILIVDDEESVLKILSTLLSGKGFETATASDGEDAMHVLEKQDFDLMLTDVRMRPMDGLALLKFAHHHDTEMPVIMLTAYASVESAIEALKHGAFDYITKPFDINELLATVDRALAYGKGVTHEGEDTSKEDVSFFLDDIVAQSDSMRDVCNKVKKIAPTDTLVTIIGEAGCGKGLLAKALHNNSKRKDKPFHKVNCAVLPEPLLEAEIFGYEKGSGPVPDTEKQGLFELVPGGTLLMEEIACLPARLQDGLMEIITSKKVQRLGANRSVAVNTRIIATSHADLEDLVKQGSFREDLCFRLNVVSLRIKPLRERTEDIIPMFALTFGRALKGDGELPDIPAETQALLKSYQWPGNAEELENAAAYAAQNLKNNKVLKESLPPKIASTPIAPGIKESEPMKARALRAFLVAEGAAEDLQKVEEGLNKPRDDTES